MPEDNVIPIDRKEVEPIEKPKRGAPKPKKAATKRTTKAAPKAAKKATTKKAATTGTGRTPSGVSKEGEQVCEFSGEKLPVTAFPTVRQSDGTYVRGTVARKHLSAWREQKRKARDAAKKEAAAKAKKAPAKKATKKATAKK